MFVIITAIGLWGYKINNQSLTLSDLGLANIEALASPLNFQLNDSYTPEEYKKMGCEAVFENVRCKTNDGGYRAFARSI